MKINSWKMHVFLLLCAFAGVFAGNETKNYLNIRKRWEQVNEVRDEQRKFSENFKLMCVAKEGFNRTLEKCEIADGFINKYHEKDFDKDGWMDRCKENYNGHVWNTTPAVMRAYHRDAFVIWCLSPGGVDRSSAHCEKLYRCMGDNVKKLQGWIIYGEKCK